MTVIKDIILKSIKEFNLEVELEDRLGLLDDSPVLGDGSKIDSIDFVNLTCIIEENIFQGLNKSISIVNEKAFSKKTSPFLTVATITKFIAELVESDVS